MMKRVDSRKTRPNGAEDRAAVVAEAAGQQRELDVEREQRHEHVGRDIGRVVGVERAGEAERGGAEREGLDLEGITCLPATAATCSSSRMARSTRAERRGCSRSISTNSTVTSAATMQR